MQGACPGQPGADGRPPTRPARRRNPTRSLAAMLVGSVLAFPFSMFAIFFLEVIGGTTFWTARDMRNLALISAVVAGGALVASVAKWRERSGESSQRARWLGWSMIVTSAAIVGVGTLYLATRTSPKNLRRPSVSGSATLGSFLTAHHGRWTTPGAPLRFDYQWQRCKPDCVYIPGATDQTYVPLGQDLRTRIRVSVTATPSTGVMIFPQRAYSNQTAPIIP